MIRLLPWLRLYAAGGGRFLESTLQERAVPLDDTLHDVVRALSRGPVASSTEVLERLQYGPERKGSVHASLSTLRGLGLLAMGDERVELQEMLAHGRGPLPLVDNIELTNICPMECAMCPTGTGRMTRPKGHMDAAVFHKLIDEIAPSRNHGKPIALHNLGESTLHPQLAELVRYASDRGLVTELSANPGHLSLKLFRALEDAGLSRLVVSLDGVDEATLTSVRGKGARAERAFANLDAILEDRRARVAAGEPLGSHGGTRVLVQLIRQARNASHAAPFLERYGALSLPSTSAYVKELDANTVEDKAITGDLYEIGRPSRPYLCRAPWRTVVVLWNGDVVPCCHDANGAVVYGNLAQPDVTLASLWEGVEANALRARLASGHVQASDPCASCAHRPDRFPMPPLDDVPEEPLHW